MSDNRRTEDLPRAFGRYELIEQLARGGMGELYLARMEGPAGWAKRVAIKQILPHLSDEPEFLARFADEARIAMRLSHGNIVPVFDMGEVDGTHFIAMDYVDGWDLRRLIRASATSARLTPVPVALRIASEVARGLSYAHTLRDDDGRAMHIVHRDVSPSNILVSRAGEVKVVDFGVASARSRLGRTLTGELKGKFSYMSPEQAEGKKADARCDIFALGSVLFELLTGTRAFEGRNDLDTLARVKKGRRADVAVLLPNLDPTVVAIVDRALAVDPADRFQSIADMQEELGRALHAAEEPISATAIAGWAAETMAVPADAGAAPGFDTLLRRHVDEAEEPDAAAGDMPDTASIRRQSVGGHTVTRSAAQVSESLLLTQTRTVRRLRRTLGIVVGLLVVAALVTLGFVLGQSDVLTPTTLRVETKPVGAQVMLDGVAWGVSTLVERVESGDHVVQIRRAGYETEERRITVLSGRENRIGLTLVPVDGDTGEATFASVQFESVPEGALISVGDSSISDGETAVVEVGAPVVIRMHLAGHAPYELTHEFRPGETRFRRRLRPLDIDTGDASPPVPDAIERRPADASPDRRRYSFRDIPAGSVFRVDGERREPGAITLDADDDPIVVQVSKQGFEAWTVRIDPSRDRSRAYSVAMAAAQMGELRVRFAGDIARGAITIDGRSRGTNSHISQVFSLEAGEHEVIVENSEFDRRLRRTVLIEEGRQATVNVDWRTE